MIRDGLPENQRWSDEGCDLHDLCLSCPFPACRYEMAPGKARALRDRARLEGLLRNGQTMNEAAETMGVAVRTAYRLRKTQAPAGER